MSGAPRSVLWGVEPGCDTAAGVPNGQFAVDGVGAAGESARSPIGWCFDIQRYSIHDGPGIRTTVFLKGCPLSCPWCHNPESVSRRPQIRVVETRCIRCGACGEVCPQGVAGGPYPPDPVACLDCGLCAEVCPTGAREIVGRAFGVDELLDAAERDRPFFEESGGGVTFSGGEPLLQAPFLLACLETARRRGLHTVVDTSGFAPRRVIERAASLTNLFLYDLKVLDPDRHLRLTGVPLEPILDNLRFLEATGANIWLRVPFVPGCNDGEADLAALAALVTSLSRTRRMHLLPYHRLGSDKCTRLGYPDRMGPTRPPSPSSLEAAAAFLRDAGVDVRLGG